MNTAYHFGVHYKSSATNAFGWYLSTSADLGSAIASGTISTVRDPEGMQIGNITATGGATLTIGFDGITLDDDSFTPIENEE
jgi:hypothetical protein